MKSLPLLIVTHARSFKWHLKGIPSATLILVAFLTLLTRGISFTGGPVDVGYLLNENFSQWRESGWVMDKTGGTWSKVNSFSFTLSDTSATDVISMSRSIVTQTSGTVAFEFKFNQVTQMSGVEWQLRNGSTVAFNVTTTGGNICYLNSGGGYTVLQSYVANQYYAVKALINISAGTSDIYVDGVLLASSVPLAVATGSVDNVFVKTGAAATGNMFLSFVRVHKGYFINERALTLPVGAMPTGEWTVTTAGGSVAVQDMGNASKPDTFGFVLTDNNTGQYVGLAKTIPPQTTPLVFEYKFLSPAKVDGTGFELRNVNSTATRLITTNGDLTWDPLSGTQLVVIPNYLANVWYCLKVVADPVAHTADVYVNQRKVLTAAPFKTNQSTIDRVTIFTSVSRTGSVWLDDLLVYPKIAEPVDYVSTPVPVASSYYVGMQVFSGWKEGQHVGWDAINAFPDREPYLGFYDEGSPEVADWEIKWMVEHGVNFQIFNWFRPAYGQGNPIKDSMLGHGLNEGFLNAKYSNLMKFAVMWTNDVPGAYSSKTDFENNIVPFWVERYFKDPRYLVIGNKPVIVLYSAARLVCDFGGTTAGAKVETDFLRNACIAAGFSGAIILTEYHFTPTAGLQTAKDVGADYVFGYGWGLNSLYPGGQQSTMTTQQSAGIINVVPSFSMGRDDLAWNSTVIPGNYLSSADFQGVGQWIKNTFMPTLPVGSLGKSMVLLDNWNEYGEGHYLAPSTRVGFGYLDAIRAVYTSGAAHTDTIPTATQLSRFNTLYPSDRSVPAVNRKWWQFNRNGNTEGWTSNGQVLSATISGGTYTATSGSPGTDPQLYSSDDLNQPINIAGIPPLTHVRIKLKNSTSATIGQIFFITTADTVWNAAKGVSFTITANDPNYTEYLVDMTANANWTGTLKRLRVDPTYTTGQFSIDEIGMESSTSAPAFTTQPATQSLVTGNSVTFTAAASGIPAPTYQWRKNGVNISGATNKSYTIASITPADAGAYTVVATNSVGVTVSNVATLLVNAPTPPVCPP